MESTTSPGITPDYFFNLSDSQALFLIRDHFAPELECLKRAYSHRELTSSLPSSPSPSQLLFKTQYDEINRTLVSILALRWLYRGQYDVFVDCQPSAQRLSHASFEWMRAFFVNSVTDQQDLYALVTSVVINDLGKDAQLASAYRKETGIDISSLNHDAILLKAADVGLVPCLERLGARQKAAVICGLRLGADFNFGQLAQAENAPACLDVLQEMQGQDYAFHLHFMEQLLDIAGAAGHLDWTCAKKLVEPILLAYRVAYDIARDIITGSLSLRGGYNRILINRARELQEKGFRVLEVEDPNDQALMRLLCMGGVSNLETAQLFDETWANLETSTKDVLVRALNLDGKPGEPAIQPTYMPALLTQATDAEGLGTREENKRALQSGLRYLARVMTADPKWDSSVCVVERDVLEVCKEIVQSSQFREDPTILERAVVPEGVVCKKQ
jgi:hypothetical protein